MELDLKVGQYVRTDLGEIGKITSIENDDALGTGEMIFYNSEPYLKGNEIKASDKLIDLLEIGDYVNGVKVTKITSNDYIELDYSYNRRGCYNEDIKSIVTKENFEQISYKVGE